jgi:hypothetical protein
MPGAGAAAFPGKLSSRCTFEDSPARIANVQQKTKCSPAWEAAGYALRLRVAHLAPFRARCGVLRREFAVGKLFQLLRLLSIRLLELRVPFFLRSFSMHSYTSQLDSWEACDEASYREVQRPTSQRKSYSPRFENRRAKSPQLSNGVHRRRNKRSYL